MEQLMIEHVQFLVRHLGKGLESSSGGIEGQRAVEDQAMLARMIFCSIGAEVIELKPDEISRKCPQKLRREMKLLRFSEQPFPNRA
jgi:hypothetical protein